MPAEQTPRVSHEILSVLAKRTLEYHMNPIAEGRLDQPRLLHVHQIPVSSCVTLKASIKLRFYK